jgi:hypothetical protein
MKTIKTVTLFIVILLTFTPVSNANDFFDDNDSETNTEMLSENDDETVTDSLQINETGADATKTKKTTKKEKSKEIVKIDSKFFLSLALNAASILIIILLIYYPNNKRLDYIFTFALFNIVIFLLTYVLNEVKISMGAAFGLFAVFSMLRYRTAGISMKDMTYLFIFIALGLISAIRLPIFELSIICGIIVVTTFILDGNILIRYELTKSIQYENIEMIKPVNHPMLIEDLKERTGLNIHRITINKIDFLKDTAVVKVFYYEK